ncbi:DUF420 domain-containing protein [Paludisphaera rhizosphaerae]|uniref:DUF420 domain-containing protein n=1 Tax=Paludisphaera rhizosphaerae TaxID=2711216 RepID=UPI0013EE24F0|nr:DUF420 domain-containing protein [Paludisphaera rhizosphaerae]
MVSGYRLGSTIVALTIVLSAGLTLAGLILAGKPQQTRPQDLNLPIGSFSLVERSGQPVTDATLADRPWIASFIFTRCKLSCPRITSIMKSLQERLSDADVRLVSVSVDPDHDTPEVLSNYAQSFEADPSRWLFLTGPQDAVMSLIHEKFLLPAMVNPAPSPDGGDEAVIHSDRLALVDGNKLIGLFDTHDPKELEALEAKARLLATPRWVRILPAVNATLNGLCTILLLAGWLAIVRQTPGAALIPVEGEAEAAPGVIARLTTLLRNPAARGHLLAMGMAVLTSAVFLSCYLVYHYFAGSKRFPGGGSLKWLYLTILTSHTLLATLFVVPLVAVTLTRALRGDFMGHLRAARVAFPIWLYVSVTGVVIYLMLYQMPIPAPSQ